MSIRTTVLSFLASILGALSVSAFAQGQLRPVRVRAVDALGRVAELSGQRRERVLIVLFTGSGASEPTSALSARLDLVLIADRSIETWIVADVTSYDNFITRPFAEAEMRRQMRDGLAERRTRRAARGAAGIDHWRLIGDFEGSIMRAFGFREVDRQPIAFVVDADSRARGPFIGPSAHGAILAAVEAARPTLAPRVGGVPALLRPAGQGTSGGGSR